MVTKNTQKRLLIYTDASGHNQNKDFVIALHDPGRGATLSLQLKNVKTSNEAEKYAVFYAILYIKKYNLLNCHILCDNKSASEDNILTNLCKNYKIGLSWIPREINVIADKMSKNEQNLKDEELNLLVFFIDLFKNVKLTSEPTLPDVNIEKLNNEIDKLKNKIDKLNKKNENQAKQINNLKIKAQNKKAQNVSNKK